MRTVPNVVVGSAMLLFSVSAWADGKSIQGTVTGTDGKPFFGAEIRAERLDVKAAPVITKTDAKGHYSFSGLPAGAYTVTTLVKGNPKSRVSVRTKGDGSAKVDFDLRAQANGANKQTAKAASTPANSNDVDNLSRMQGRMGGNINNMSFPGHG